MATVYILDDVAKELEATAKSIVAPGKGILAADESALDKKFKPLGIPCTPEMSQKYRQMLFKAPDLNNYISGVILHNDTMSQSTDEGVPFPTFLAGINIIPGIKVDKGLVPISFDKDGNVLETTTQGLDDLTKRCQEYYKAGCRFAKFRCTLKIGDGLPTDHAIEANAFALARYAFCCQLARIVPIVEPEVLTDGTHTLEKCKEVTILVLKAVYKQLAIHHVHLPGTLLKPNMVTPGAQNPQRSTPAEVAKATVEALQTVPASVPGIDFLSGGQTEEEASVNLSAINNDPGNRPWKLTFSFGRALQQSAVTAWGGNEANVGAGQVELLKRAKANSEASLGKYTGGAVGVAGQEGLHVKNHTY